MNFSLPMEPQNEARLIAMAKSQGMTAEDFVRQVIEEIIADAPEDAARKAHTAIWYLFSDPRLGKAASVFIDDAVGKGDHIGVSAITIAEIVYLVEKGRIPATALDDLHAATADPKAVLRHVPVDETIVLKMVEIPRQDLPDLPDRVVAATALFLRVPVLSRDKRIRSSSIQTIG